MVCLPEQVDYSQYSTRFVVWSLRKKGKVRSREPHESQTKIKFMTENEKLQFHLLDGNGKACGVFDYAVQEYIK